MALDSLVNDNINTDLSEEILHKWDHIISIITEDDIFSKELEVSEADKYIADFNGLLLSLNIPEKFWFPHTRLNNFKSFAEYDGRTTIYLLENSFLDTIYNNLSNNSILL